MLQRDALHGDWLDLVNDRIMLGWNDLLNAEWKRSHPQPTKIAVLADLEMLLSLL